MGIDYVIHYTCQPKQALTLEGLIGRLKGRDRAKAIIQLYRENGDQRPPSQMGFEMVRRLPDGSEESEVIIVQDLLNSAAELTPWEPYCATCPANRVEEPFGCIGTINYPISEKAERWLLDQLPKRENLLSFMLLSKAIKEMGYTGDAASRLRSQEEVFLESTVAPVRDFETFTVSGNQIFEMLFLSGHIQPTHGSLLLQFFGAIPTDLEADTMMQLAVPPSQEWIDQNVPFLLKPQRGDDISITSFKAFFQAIYIGYRLSVPVLLDV